MKILTILAIISVISLSIGIYFDVLTTSILSVNLGCKIIEEEELPMGIIILGTFNTATKEIIINENIEGEQRTRAIKHENLHKLQHELGLSYPCRQKFLNYPFWFLFNEIEAKVSEFIP